MTRRTIARVICLGAALVLMTACGAPAPAPTPAPKVSAPAATGSPKVAAPASTSKPAALADGTFVMDPTQSTVFLIQDGKRRGFTDQATYLAWGGKPDGSNVVHRSASQLAAIPEGEIIPPGSKP